MKPEEHLKELFAQALERKSAAERENFLAEACKHQPEVRQQVYSLLRAHEQAGDFLGQTIRLPPPDFDPEAVGTMIGRYKLLEKIGEGGFGVVYMAEQQQPVQRKVALKIIKAGMDTREVIARFEAERQALALMDHPNIARVLDGGATEAGRPYFVMEMVRGIPITDYCDQNNLSTTERLRLFVKVCQAVQHAHQKAVIHRDLKPSNILVTLQDGEPVPKVIDFGVAKALGQKLTEKTLFTAFRQMIGTPAYMSPEQAEMSGLDIDTRADIYSLGVLLYELLTSVTPFDRETLAKAALDEIRRMIRETEPPKPSTRLRALGEKLPDVAKHRDTEPAALSRLVRGDLDWIVMRCLEKDRTRRYETANGLAKDIQRHLNNEPVLASPPSAIYRLRKLVRRNKPAFAAGTLVSAALAMVVIAFFKEFQAGKYGGVEINTYPEGAEVWLKGARMGTTPYEATRLTPGKVTYGLKLTNHEPFEAEITIAARKQTAFTFFLDAPKQVPTNSVSAFSTYRMGKVVEPLEMTLVELQGTVELSPKGATRWLQVSPNLLLRPGDRLRTGRFSRATLRWSDGSVVSISQLTELEIIKGKGSSKSNRIIMPPAIIGIRG